MRKIICRYIQLSLLDGRYVVYDRKEEKIIEIRETPHLRAMLITKRPK